MSKQAVMTGLFGVALAASAVVAAKTTATALTGQRAAIPESILRQLKGLKGIQVAYFPVHGPDARTRGRAWKELIAMYGTRGWRSKHTGGHWVWWRNRRTP